MTPARAVSILSAFALAGCVVMVGVGLSRSAPAGAHDAANAVPLQNANDAGDGDGDRVDFAREVLPILSNNCFLCHGPDQDSAEAQAAGFRLDVREEAVGFGMIEPGNAEASLVLDVLTTSRASRKMPPLDSGKPQLTAEQIDILRRWINQGAEYTDHWSFVKPSKPALPDVSDAAWPSNDIDYFVHAKLEELGLSPNEPADRRRLIRRVYLDLIGLPPTPEQADAFANDSSPDAYTKVVDELLASPHFGEHWAQPWLDKARYADSQGFEKDRPRTMWRYRDWVIQAMNDDMPFDRFTREQIAGDLLENPTLDQLIATGLHRNTQTNTEGGTDDEEFRVAAVMDRTNTTMEVWMGITMGCVQCHTHKYDPILHEEYYAFYDFFNQTEDADRFDDKPYVQAPTPEQQREIEHLQQQIEEASKELADPDRKLAESERAWERSVLETEPTWYPLTITSAESNNRASLTIQDDGSVHARGGRKDTAIYTINADTDVQGITALRIEVLPDREGNSENRVAVLSELQLAAQPIDAMAAPPQARYLRIDLPGKNKILSLAEVQAYDGETNVAIGSKVVQSSTDFSGQAFFAVDGFTAGDFEEQGVTHTEIEDDPWWEADLGAGYSVDRVVLWNRTDNASHRLNGAVVTLLDSERSPLWSQRLDQVSAEPMALATTGLQRILLANPSATSNQAGQTVFNAIDADAKTGWAFAGQTDQNPTAVFETTANVGGQAGGTTLTLTLEQRQAIKRFRIAVTDQPRPVRVVPDDIVELLAIDNADRTPAQAQRVYDYYLQVAPETEVLRRRIERLRQQLAQVRQQVPTALVMKQLPEDRQRETYLFNGGSFLAPDKERGMLGPGTPAVFHPFPQDAPRDRRGLAQWLTHDDNPLTARVQVNRVWEQIWGIGLVQTTNDFGFQSSYPSNLELLDYLAVTYQQDMAWSLKSLLKLIVTSSSYRQSAVVSSGRLEIDPFNRYMSRGPRMRLSAEQIRDQALAVSGLLRGETIGGPSVMPYLPEGMLPQAFDTYVQQSSSGEDVYRRGLYTVWRRTGHYPSFAAFDAPSREICTIIRSRTNTPLQALVTLNDPVYVEAAQSLGRRMMIEAGDDLDARLARGMNLVLARDPSDDERDVLRALYRDSLAAYELDLEAAKLIATEPIGPLPEGIDPADAAAMTLVGNVLLNLDELINKP